MKKIFIYIFLLVVFDFVLWIGFGDPVLCVILFLAGSIIIALISMKFILEQLHVPDLQKKIDSLGNKKIQTVTRRYTPSKISELRKVDEVANFFSASICHKDTKDYVTSMEKPLVFGGVSYVFLTAIYIITFLGTSHAETSMKELFQIKGVSTVAYLGILLAYFCFYISPIIIYRHKNHVACSEDS